MGGEGRRGGGGGGGEGGEGGGRGGGEDRVGWELVGPPSLAAAIKREPLREKLRALLMLALYRAGRQADALAAYQDARRTLVGELGLEPGRELHELQAAILAHDPALDAPPPGAVSRKRRARSVIALGACALVLTAAALALALSRGGEVTGLAVLSANSVGAIDPDTGKIVAQVPLGAHVAQLAAAGNAVGTGWTERTLYRSTREAGSSPEAHGSTGWSRRGGLDAVAWVLDAGASGRDGSRRTPPIRTIRCARVRRSRSRLQRFRRRAFRQPDGPPRGRVGKRLGGRGGVRLAGRSPLGGVRLAGRRLRSRSPSGARQHTAGHPRHERGRRR